VQRSPGLQATAPEAVSSRTAPGRATPRAKKEGNAIGDQAGRLFGSMKAQYVRIDITCGRRSRCSRLAHLWVETSLPPPLRPGSGRAGNGPRLAHGIKDVSSHTLLTLLPHPRRPHTFIFRMAGRSYLYIYNTTLTSHGPGPCSPQTGPRRFSFMRKTI
jgi:hypothetical protein